MFDRGYIKSMARWRLQTERSNAILAALADYYPRQGIDPEPIVGCTAGDCSC